MNNLRKILGVTGIRSEYDIMSSVYKAIEEHPGLDLELAVTGAHLSDAYGATVEEIRQDGFKISDEIQNLINSDNAAARVKGLGIQLQGLVQTVCRVNPDILLVLGDREESITTALVGAYMNIPVAHVAGGDRVVGNVDDQVRHAVSKLAHVHFVTNSESYERLVKLGEQEFRIHNTGNPGLDRLLDVPRLTRMEIGERLGFKLGEEPFILLIQHVISSEIEYAYEQMEQTLLAVAELGVKAVISYPNSDAGGQKIIKAIQEFSHYPFIYAAKNIPRLEFVNLMREASCLLGNSSAGIMEAPLMKLPVVNVGNRQKGRLHAENVIFVPHDRKIIIEALNKSIYDSAYRASVNECNNPYGDGKSSFRIADILASIEVNEEFLIKDITY